MLRSVLTLACFSAFLLPHAQEEKAAPSIDYDTARQHEVKPHRRIVPIAGVANGSDQLHLMLTISETGDVLHVFADGPDNAMKLWPQLQGEVTQWKFTPFEEHGKAITATVEEYLDLVPPERLPKVHVAPPTLTKDSKIEISLQRSGCFGSCPAYTVTVGTTGILFEGSSYVVAAGKHVAPADPDAVRKLVKDFIAADFYSMDPIYEASVTDHPTYLLKLNIDGHAMQVQDYVGSWVGMPAIITDLENEVDTVANSARWIAGTDGLVQALKAEKFHFQTWDAQVMLKSAAERNEAATVRQLLQAGVPLKPLPSPKPKAAEEAIPFDNVGWLAAAGGQAQALQVLIDAGASKTDQADKDDALDRAAASGSLEAVRALIAYGANPEAHPSIPLSVDGTALPGSSRGSVLIAAAISGNPDVVAEILRHKPNLERRNRIGQTAISVAGEYVDDKYGGRVECVRLLVQAGADINARDRRGNTPLHSIYLNEVREELLKLGANVNARNNKGETPLFTTADDDAIWLLLDHGADPTLRNNEGETALEAAAKDPHRQEVLRLAIRKHQQR